MVIGPGRAHDGAIGLPAQERGILDEHRRPAADRADHRRHARVVSVANAHGFASVEVDAVEVLDEGRDEVLTGLLAVGDDVDAAPLLLVHDGAQSIAFAVGEHAFRQLPGRPQHLGLASHAGLGGSPPR
jgi:hypothetical protein